MVAWKKQFTTDQIREVTAFIATLRGKNVAGKPPEGELWSPEPAAAEGGATEEGITDL